MTVLLSDLVTLRDAAMRLGISRIGAQKLVERGKLVPAGKIGGAYVFQKQEVRRRLNELRRRNNNDGR